MVNNLRSPEIIKLANQQSIVRVEELAEYFNVSLQTIRKDLNKLCSDGQLERVHGGAIIPSHIANIEYEQRKKLICLENRPLAENARKKFQMTYACSWVLAQVLRPQQNCSWNIKIC